jgi:adenosylhomocysteine nucleosidase
MTPTRNPRRLPLYDQIAIVAAMEREISFLRSEMIPHSTRDDRFAVGTIGSKTVMLVRTGVGPQKTAQRLSEFTGMCSPQCVLSIGCAGGLRPYIKTGDVILSEKVIADAGDGHEQVTSQELVQAAKDCCKRLKLPFHSGNTVSASVVVATPEDKNNLAEKHAALSVDMETAQVAAWADGLGIPLLAVRTVLDTVDDTIPREIAL